MQELHGLWGTVAKDMERSEWKIRETLDRVGWKVSIQNLRV